MSPKLYLAGPSRELARVREAAFVLTASGFDLTARWWDRIEADRGGRPTDAGVPTAVLRESWVRNTSGILVADGVIALASTPSGLSNGVREEIAYALGMYERDVGAPRRVVIVGDPGPSLAVTGCVVVETVGQAVEMLGGGA